MAIAPGNALFQLKKGSILAPAIFANLRERQEVEVRERPETEGTMIFWLHRWESSGRTLSVGKCRLVKSYCSRSTHFTPIFSTVQETSAIPPSRTAQRSPATTTPTPPLTTHLAAPGEGISHLALKGKHQPRKTLDFKTSHPFSCKC